MGFCFLGLTASLKAGQLLVSESVRSGKGVGVAGKLSEQVEAGHPEVTSRSVLCPQFVDSLLGDQMELSVGDETDCVDFGEADALLEVLEGLIRIVAETTLEDKEVPALPDGQQS